MLRTNRNFWLLSFAALVVLSVSLFSKAAVPLYDGVGFPDEPYRYVEPPKLSLKTPKAPGIATGTYPTDNLTDGVFANSGEYFPQISIYLDSSVLIYPAAASSVTIIALPQAPHSEPSGWTIDGNVYHFTGSTDDGPLALKAHSIDVHHYRTIDMRLPQGYPAYPTFFYQSLNSSKWEQLQTLRVGNDIYEAVIVNFGNYALAHKNNASSEPTRPKAKSYIVQVVIVVVLLVICATILIIRRREKTAKPRPKSKKKKK